MEIPNWLPNPARPARKLETPREPAAVPARDEPPCWPEALTGFAAGVCALVYHPFLSIRLQLSGAGAHAVHYFDIGGTQAVAFTCGEHDWLVFRGSETFPEREMFVDWGHDLFFLRCGSPARHRGFTRAFGKVREPLREWLRARTATRKLVIAGHSLGGALALVAADEIAREQLARIEAVITFGAPKVGSAEWVSQYATLSASPEEARRLGDVTWRIVNRGDIVTRLPPFWYAHCGKLVEFYNAEPVPLVPVRSGLMPTAKFGAALAPRQGDGTVAWLRYGIAAVQGTAPFAPLWLLLDALLAIAESAPAHFIRNYGPAFPKRPFRHVCAPTGLPGMRTALDYMLVPVKWLIVLAILAAVLGVAWLFYSIFPDFTLIAAAFTLLHLVISYPFADVAPRKPKLPIWIGRGGPHRS